MKLIHTLLFFLRENAVEQDMDKVERCLKSLEKSAYRTVVVFNQGFWSNEQLEDYLKPFGLDCIVIGEGVNKGIVAGRQGCFEYIWENHPDTMYISELHLDMIFTDNWESTLVEYLDTHDEPLVCSGNVDKNGWVNALNFIAKTPPDIRGDIDGYLNSLKVNSIVHGFTHPCIHKSVILKEVGGYDTCFLTGKQAFEDDSLLLGYHYYYGTKANWKPKVDYRSMVYHEVCGQRNDVNDNIMINFGGLIRQYGAMGLKHLANVHQSAWHIRYFTQQYNAMRKL